MGFGQYSYDSFQRTNPFKFGSSERPGKPKREVFKGHEIAHMWAHRTQSRARVSTGNYYFDGATIYSYGSHFPIARFIDLPNGQTVVLFRDTSRSVTTSGHQNAVRSAIPKDIPRFNVVNFTGEDSFTELLTDRDHRLNVATYISSINDSLDKAKRARKNKSNYERDALNLRNELRSYAQTFGLDVALPELGEEVAALAQWICDNRAAELERRRVAEIEREMQERLRRAEEITKFRAGDPDVYAIYGLSPILRIRNGNVETSLGAAVPIDHARKALRLVRTIRKKHSSYDFATSTRTIHLGNYRLNRFDDDGITAGCHVIKWEEIDRIAPELEREAA